MERFARDSQIVAVMLAIFASYRLGRFPIALEAQLVLLDAAARADPDAHTITP